jgi:hypothetical protein
MDRNGIVPTGAFDRFVADAESPLDVWLNYPGVILPEALARAQI